MAWYMRSSRLIYLAFRRYSLRSTLVRTPVQESISRTNFYLNIRKPSCISRVSEFSPPIFSNSALQNGLKSVHCNSPFLNGAKRFYSVSRNRNSVSHFRQRESKGWIKYLAFSCYILVTVYPEAVMFNEEYLETVPFTNRIHYVLLSPESEKEIGKKFEENLRAKYKDKILPPDHAENIRVQGIARNIIEASQRALEIYEGRSDIRYSPGRGSVGLPHKTSSPETLMRIFNDKNIASEGKRPKEDKILDDHWVQDGREVAKGTKSGSRHLEGMEWEVIVLDEPKFTASCKTGGKIVISSEFLERLRLSDTEIAFVMAHEVAHVVARHGPEKLSKFKWWGNIEEILLLFLPYDDVNLIKDLLQHPLRTRLEIEADYIAVLVMAFAGYDPRVAPELINKLESWDSRFLRVSFLRQAVQEAMNIYRETFGKSSMQPARTFAISKQE